jgi:hypothetical protein
MIRSTIGPPSIKRAALSAYVAGATGILANTFLIAFYALLATHFERVDAILGSASDLVGSLATAFMIPVALVLGWRLPHRRLARLTQAGGLTAMALLSMGGPLLVLGVVPFDVETPVSVAAWLVLCLWLLLINRWLRLSAALPARVARFGEVVGGGPLVGGVIVGLAFLLPWMSWVQLIFFGVGGLPGFFCWLAIPVWFVLLGRDLRWVRHPVTLRH